MSDRHEQAPPLGAAIKAACPRCGAGPLFKSFLNIELREACSNCGLDYKFIDTGDGPAWFAMVILSVGVLGAALWLEFRFEPPLWVHVLVWGIVTPILALVLIRFLKALLTALQYRHKAEQGRLQKD